MSAPTYPVLEVTNETPLQDIFDAVVAHLIKQGKRATAKGMYCLYRTDDQLACAVGCLLSDEEARQLDRLADPDDGLAVDSARLHPVAPDWLKDPRNNQFLKDLQLVHDAPESWEYGLSTSGRRALQRVALKWGISP